MVKDDGVGATLARIETKLDAVIDDKKDHERRLRSLEKWRWSHVITAAPVAVILAKLGIPIPGGH